MQQAVPLAPHDIPPDPMGRAFFGSLVTHGVIAALLVTSGLWHFSATNLGSQTPSTGSVGVELVKTIPIPRKEAPPNPLANDTKSVVPEAPAPAVKLQKQVKEQPKDAIPIPDKVQKPKKLSPQQQVTSLFRPPEAYKSNQVYSSVPQAMSSPMYGIQGSNGIDFGPNAVFGERFAAYANLLRDRISQHWNRAGLRPSSERCVITFTVARDGTVSNVQVSRPSRDYLLDTSARRAIIDSNPLSPLPQQFEHNEATIEIGFQIQQ